MASIFDPPQILGFPSDITDQTPLLRPANFPLPPCLQMRHDANAGTDESACGHPRVRRYREDELHPAYHHPAPSVFRSQPTFTKVIAIPAMYAYIPTISVAMVHGRDTCTDVVYRGTVTDWQGREGIQHKRHPLSKCGGRLRRPKASKLSTPIPG